MSGHLLSTLKWNQDYTFPFEAAMSSSTTLLLARNRDDIAKERAPRWTSSLSLYCLEAQLFYDKRTDLATAAIL
jgi:hypothetical protein